MLITERTTPLIADKEIKCFKVMLQWKTWYYWCPPAFQYFLNNKIEPVEYHLNELYETESTDPNKDYRVNWNIWIWFYHTFCDLESAQAFAQMINNKIRNPQNTHHPELYTIPEWAKIVILNAHIPQGSLYYEWTYQWEKNKICEKTYASNKIVYEKLI